MFSIKIECYNANWENSGQVGKGLCEDVSGQKLAFQHWIEAVIYSSSTPILLDYINSSNGKYLFLIVLTGEL